MILRASSVDSVGTVNLYFTKAFEVGGRGWDNFVEVFDLELVLLKNAM
jgi:hypothetical protein